MLSCLCMDLEVTNLIYGFAFSLIGGHIACWSIHVGIGFERPTHKRLPPYMMGMIERLFFTIITITHFTVVPYLMMSWLVLKMVTNWNSAARQDRENKEERSRAILALGTGLLSMLFAFGGGLICMGLDPSLVNKYT